MPKVLINAVLAAEDHRFFEHGGVDLRALARAAWANLRAGRVKEGGSTITQQLVKVRLLNPKRTFFRKLREAWLAALVEARYSKERILEAYLNEIYLGQRGSIAIRGVGSAARAYFGKEVHQLTTPEAALIAAIIRGPNVYSPAVDPDRARDHRNIVLGQMRDLKMITADEYERSRRTPVKVRSLVSPGQSAPYFVDYVRQELEQRFDTGVARPRGVRIVTTLDLSLQRFAEAAAVRGLDRLESSVSPGYRRDPTRRLQVAMVVVDPATGESARWSAAATISPVSSIASHPPAASRARPSSRSCTWPPCARRRAGRRSSPPPRAWRTYPSPSSPGASPGAPETPKTGTRASSPCGRRSSSRSTPPPSASRKPSGFRPSSRWRGLSASRASWRPCPRWRSARSR
jgi:membrane carboxypeptidase/penicillin-binding protein